MMRARQQECGSWSRVRKKQSMLHSLYSTYQMLLSTFGIRIPFDNLFGNSLTDNPEV